VSVTAPEVHEPGPVPAAEPATAVSHVGGRVVYLLILVALLHFIYPITLETSGPLPLILYNILYSAMFAAGIFVVGADRRLLILTVATALVYCGFSFLYALNPADTMRALVTYLALIPFQATLVYVLARYMFAARHVNRDVLYAAVTVYLLLGAIFVPIYGIVEMLHPGAFVDNLNPGAPVVWQQLIYYSLVTLTTTGYGDVLPAWSWARALANAESVVGVLFIAITMARLVGIYSRDATD